MLQALGFHCCRLKICLTCSHVAGERNVWADALSTHDRVPAGFSAENQEVLDVLDVLQAPWTSAPRLGDSEAC